MAKAQGKAAVRLLPDSTCLLLTAGSILRPSAFSLLTYPPSLLHQTYPIPRFHPVDALASIAKDSASYAACRPLLDSHTSSPAAAPFDVLPSCPFVAIRILYPEGSEGWGESLLIGTIGLHPDDEPSPNGAEAVRTWEVGYVLDPEFRGKGWMGEAVGELFKTMEGWLKGTMDRWGAWGES